jgi:hypothetical protein
MDMRKCILFTCLSFVSLILLCQDSKDFFLDYEDGLKCLNNQSYKKADSLISNYLNNNPLSMYFKNSRVELNDVYFNLAIAKIGIKDTCSFCTNIYSAATLNDKDANALFNKVCISKVDSIFLDKNYNTCNKIKSRYIKVEYYDKYNNDIKGQILDVKLKNSSLSKVKFVSYGNIVGLYSINNSDTLFTMLSFEYHPKFKKWNQDFYSFIDSKVTCPAKKDAVYNIYKQNILTVNYKVIINKYGKFESIKFKSTSPSNLDKIFIDEALKVVKLTEDYIEPAKILGNNVKVEMEFPINFNLK